MASSVGLIARFGLAGLVNTAIGFAVVVVLDPVLGLAPPIANAIGYAVGMAVGFMLNRGFVFRHQGALPATGLRYVIAALAAFVLNQVVLHLAGGALGGAPTHRLMAQVMAMAVYSVVFFGLCRLWVFRGAANSPAA